VADDSASAQNGSVVASFADKCMALHPVVEKIWKGIHFVYYDFWNAELTNFFVFGLHGKITFHFKILPIYALN
jgi:hypothetical protein